MQSVLICSIPNPLSPALSMSTLLKSFVLMMRNYQQMLVRWSLISLCQGCWQAWHEWLPVMTLKSSVSVSHYGETPGGGVHTQLSSVAFFLTLPKHWHLTVSLAMSAETERWNRSLGICLQLVHNLSRAWHRATLAAEWKSQLCVQNCHVCFEDTGSDPLKKKNIKWNAQRLIYAFATTALMSCLQAKIWANLCKKYRKQA